MIELSSEGALPQTFEELICRQPLPDGAAIRTARVPYERDGTQFEGFVATDVAVTGPRKGILLLHAWTGVGPNVQMRARMLARLGYVAFAADLYGAGIRPTAPADAAAEAAKHYSDLPRLRRRVLAGLDVLVHDLGVDLSKIVVAGYCFGGTAALEFARTGTPVAGVVSFHGNLISPDPGCFGTIAVPLLIVAGGSDDLVPDDALMRFLDTLRAHPEVDWQVALHGGAPHAFTVPGSDRFRPIADQRSWGQFTAFLDERLAPSE
ncbi:dienelactone hydrolase family protein [Herbiconiux sp. 11R-BC]|uniref:dienelactone hydrolase family protein n=1 Tax=Herbiconiux sp. 11R-BC TaxID=3111637 RepID=UPI003BFF4055